MKLEYALFSDYPYKPLAELTEEDREASRRYAQGESHAKQARTDLLGKCPHYDAGYSFYMKKKTIGQTVIANPPFAAGATDGASYSYEAKLRHGIIADVRQYGKRGIWFLVEFPRAFTSHKRWMEENWLEFS